MTCCSRSEHFKAEFVTTQTSAEGARIEGQKAAPRRWSLGEGTPPPQPTREFGEHRKLPGSAANEFVEFYTATSRLCLTDKRDFVPVM